MKSTVLVTTEIRVQSLSMRRNAMKTLALPSTLLPQHAQENMDVPTSHT